MSQKLNNGTTEVNIEDIDGLGGLAIRLTQPAKPGGVVNTAQYRFEVYAETKEGNYLVGSFATSPPGRQLSRVVAMANCPGAKNWKLVITLVRGTAYDGGEVSMSVGRPAGELPGVTRVSERFDYYTGNAPGTVSILPGETVLGWTATASGGAGSVQIGSGGSIPVPNGGSMSGGGGGLIEGPIDFTFGTNVNGYLIEVAESA